MSNSVGLVHPSPATTTPTKATTTTTTSSSTSKSQTIEATAPNGRRRIDHNVSHTASTPAIASACAAASNNMFNVDDEFYYETQPRSLAALAERDRRREQLYLQQQQQQQQQLQQAKSLMVRQALNSATNETNATEISRAQIVNEKVVVVAPTHESPANQSSVSISSSQNNGKSSVLKRVKSSTIATPTTLTVSNTNVAASESVCGTGASDNNRSENMENFSGLPTTTYHANDKMAVFAKSDRKFKPGFLSRFSGFRFSLRGNKKKVKSTEQLHQPHEPPNNQNNCVLVSKKLLDDARQQVVTRPRPSDNNSGRVAGYQRNSMRSNDFVYIPLKDPLNKCESTTASVTPQNKSDTSTTTTITAVAAAAPVVVEKKSPTKSDVTNPNDNSKKPVLTGKPPLPKQPPRVVGVCAKPPAASLRHAHQQRSMSAPREMQPSFSGYTHHQPDTDDGDGDDDVNFYYNQLRFGRDRLNQTYGGATMTSALSSDGILLDESAYADHNDTTIDDDVNDSKIGLIETNLDTDETIISGKTRSLMELGPQQLSMHRMSGGVARRLHGRNAIDGVGNGTGASVQPRRPHKSMEFLLDKENQKFVLVSKNSNFILLFVVVSIHESSLYLKCRECTSFSVT